MTELVTHKPQSTVEHYHDTFVSLLNQLCLPESYVLSIFISNIKGDISQYLRLFKPQTLVEAYQIAIQVEEIIANPQRKTHFLGGTTYSKPFLPSSKEYNRVQTSTETRKIQPASTQYKAPIKSLFPSELEEHRKKVLCFWCASKYTPGHKCLKSQLCQLVVEAFIQSEEDPKA